MEYKNLHSYTDFLNEKHNLNEGLLGKLFGFLKGKLKKYYNEIEAAKKIDPIFDEVQKTIDGYFDDKDLVADLTVKAKAKLGEGDDDGKGDGKDDEGDESGETGNDEEVSQDENLSNKYNNKKLFEQVDGESILDDTKKKPEEMTEEEKEMKKLKDKEEADRKTFDNLLDSAITQTLKNLDKKIEPHIKDDKGKIIYTAKMYAQLKRVNLEDEIIKKKIELYKTQNIDTSSLAQELKLKGEVAVLLNKQMEQAVKELKEKSDKLTIGQIVNYKGDKGSYRGLVVNNDPLTLIRMSDKGDKAEKNTVTDDEVKQMIVKDKNAKKIEEIGSEYIEDIEKIFADRKEELAKNEDNDFTQEKLDEYKNNQK